MVRTSGVSERPDAKRRAHSWNAVTSQKAASLEPSSVQAALLSLTQFIRVSRVAGDME
jgi:hypothetical protein